VDDPYFSIDGSTRRVEENVLSVCVRRGRGWWRQSKVDDIPPFHRVILLDYAEEVDVGDAEPPDLRNRRIRVLFLQRTDIGEGLEFARSAGDSNHLLSWMLHTLTQASS